MGHNEIDQPLFTQVSWFAKSYTNCLLSWLVHSLAGTACRLITQNFMLNTHIHAVSPMHQQQYQSMLERILIHGCYALHAHVYCLFALALLIKQPTLYKKIQSHPDSLAIYEERLVKEGTATKEVCRYLFVCV
jgi:hypothetical protein